MESKHITFTALISLQVLFPLRATNNPMLNSTNALKLRNELVDETFLEQKDVLLDMLEAKLKEVRDKKKSHKYPNKADIKLSANGIVALGESDIKLKYGNNGNANLNLNATGISNVGKIRLDMASADRAVNLPGLDTLFNGPAADKNSDTNDDVRPIISAIDKTDVTISNTTNVTVNPINIMTYTRMSEGNTRSSP